jgi:hypothetical protein
MRLDNVAIDLQSSTTLHRAPGVSLEGSNYPILVKIGDVAGRPSGDYQDMLTITVSP